MGLELGLRGVGSGFGGELAALVEAGGLNGADDVAVREVFEIVFGGIGVGVGEFFYAGVLRHAVGVGRGVEEQWLW